MTKQKDLKKHIRARAAKTGESYSEARRNLLAETVAKEMLDAENSPEVQAIMTSAVAKLADILGANRVVPLGKKAGGPIEQLTVDLPPKEAAAFVEDLKQKWNETVGKDIDPALRERLDALKVEPEERICEQCQKPLADGEKHFRDFNIPSMRCISLRPPPTDAELEVLNAKSGVPPRATSEELVQVRGFAQPVPKAMADAIEVLRQQVRDDVTKQDAVFESLFEQAKEKEPELLWAGKGGQVGQAVFRTEFDKVMVESAKAYPLTPYEREHLMGGPTPADLWRKPKPEASEEELKALAAAVANSPACICGPALGAVKECPFHHPPVVLDPEKTTLDAAAMATGVDVGRVLLDRAIKAHADGSDSKADRERIAPSFAVKDAFKNAEPVLPVKDVAPLLEALKYINGGDAHADEAREEAREALDAFDKLHPKVLTALVDPYAKADSLDLDAEEEIAVRLNGEKVTLARVSDYETIVARAGLSGTPSMTFRKGKAGGILHPGEPLFIEKNMVLNVVHTGNA